MFQDQPRESRKSPPRRTNMPARVASPLQPPAPEEDLVGMPLSARSDSRDSRSLKMRNKIQPRSPSYDSQGCGGGQKIPGDIPEDIPEDSEDVPQSVRAPRRPQIPNIGSLRQPPPSAWRGVENRQDDARDLQLLRELSSDITDQLCQSVRAAVREELQSVLRGHREAPGVPGSAADADGVKLHRGVSKLAASMAGGRVEHRADIKESADLKEITRQNTQAIGRRLTDGSDADDNPDLLRGRTPQSSIQLLCEPVLKAFPASIVCFAPLYRLADWFSSLEEPERTGCIATLALSTAFELYSFLGIALNCVFMIASADYEVQHYWETDTTDTLRTMELLFLIWFGIEHGVKLYVHRMYFFVSSSWKIRALDTVLIMFQVWSVLGNYGLMRSQHNLSFVRAIKMLRVLRVVRALKAMHHFKQLHAMLLAIQTSLLTLLWSMLLVTGILWMFSLLFVQVTTAHFQEVSEQLGVDELDSSELSTYEVALMENFGSVGETMVCLLMASTGGQDWSIYYNALEPTSFVYQLVFLIFIALMQFAVLNIVTGIFVDTAMTQMKPDPEEAAKEALKIRQKQEQDLLAVCRDADSNHNGHLNRQEFLKAIKAGKLTGFLDSLGFRKHDLIDFFLVLESSTPERKVDVNVFVDGCMELSGGATRFGVKAMLMEVEALRETLADLRLDLFAARVEPGTPLSSTHEDLTPQEDLTPV